jgi:hypothetical protein
LALWVAIVTLAGCDVLRETNHLLVDEHVDQFK